IAVIDGDLQRARLELSAALKLQESVKRLVEKKAAPAIELDQVGQRIEAARANVAALEKQRSSLVSQPDRESAQARLREAEVAAEAARRRMDESVVTAPMGGTVYQLDVRKGGYVHAGDPIAAVGNLERVRVSVFIDEPELGNIRTGQPVVITW